MLHKLFEYVVARRHSFLLFAASAALVLFWIAIRKAPSVAPEMPDLKARSAPVVTPSPAASVEVAERSTIPSPREISTERATELRFLPQHRLHKSVYGVALPLSIEFLNLCEGPDFDWFREQFLDDGNRFVEISVESLDTNDSSFRPVSQRISGKLFLNGAQITLTLPSVAGVKHLGLFACTSRAAGERCSSMPPIQLDRHTKMERASGDALFYFSYLVLAQDVLYSAPSELPAMLEDSLGASYSSDNPVGTLARVRPKVKRFEQVIGSSPLNVHDPISRIQLPMFFQGRCGEKRR